MIAASTPQREARCPRCGYDQRGVIEAWAEACPLRGRCTECGVDFTWPELLRPELHEPRWCIEYVPRRRPIGLPPVRWTILRSLWPWGFWRSLRMSNRIRAGRLAYFACALAVVVAAGYALEQSIVAVAVRSTVETQVRQQYIARMSRLRSFIANLKDLETQAIAAAGNEAQKQAVQAEIQRRLQGMQAQLDAPPAAAVHPYPAAIIEAVLAPRSGSSKGTITMPARAMPYPAPRKLHSRLMGSSRLWSRRSFRPRNLAPWVVGAGAGLCLVVLMPLGFVLLPASRRRAKVRWSHIARVALYSLVIPALVASAVFLMIDLAVAWAAWRPAVLAAAEGALTFVPIPLVVAWWAAAIRCYLRMPRAWLMATALAVMNLLLVTVALQVVVPEAGERIVDLLAQ